MISDCRRIALFAYGRATNPVLTDGLVDERLLTDLIRLDGATAER